MDEDFRTWFERTRGMPYPTRPEEHELLHVVTRRIGDALADWADEIAARAERK